MLIEAWALGPRIEQETESVTVISAAEVARRIEMLADWRRRKKDHGRAEAMLIAAWALGVRIERETESVIVVPAAELEGSSEDAEDVLPLEDEVQEAAC